MNIRRAFAALAASFALAAPAWAAPPSDESLETLMVVTRSESMMDSMYASMEPLMRQMAQQAMGERKLDDEGRRLMDEMLKATLAVIREDFSWPRLKPMMIAIYRDSFDQSEVDGLIAFYRSPTGQAFIAKMPAVMQRSMQLTQGLMPGMMQRMQAAVQKVLEDAKARRNGQS